MVCRQPDKSGLYNLRIFWCAYKMCGELSLPNARADLPRIEDANRESGCEGDNRG